MSDLIRRDDAIEALAELARERFTIQDYFQIYLDALTAADIKIRQLPSAQPERIKSKWALHTYMPHNKFCLACRNDSPYNKRWDFCPNCGAKMEVNNEIG